MEITRCGARDEGRRPLEGEELRADDVGERVSGEAYEQRVNYAGETLHHLKRAGAVSMGCEGAGPEERVRVEVAELRAVG